MNEQSVESIFREQQVEIRQGLWPLFPSAEESDHQTSLRCLRNKYSNVAMGSCLLCFSWTLI